MYKILKDHSTYILSIVFVVISMPTFTHALDADTVNRHLLQTIKIYMNPEKNPCDDFYQYACGHWEFVHWDENKYVDTIGRLEYETNEHMAMLLERVMHSGKSKHNIIYYKLQNYYMSCRLTEYEYGYDMEYYLDLFFPTGYETTWPYRLNERNLTWQGQGFNWMETLGKLRASGLDNVLIKETVKSINATHFIIELTKPDGVGLNANEYQYYRRLKDSAQTDSKKLKELIRKLKHLYKHYTDAKTPQLFTLSQLKQKIPQLDVSAYLKRVLQQLPLTNDTLLLVSNVAYLRRLVELLSVTPKETIAYYIMLKLQSYLGTQLPLSNSIQHCMQHMRQHMPLALDYMYDREYYTPYRRNQSDPIIRDVFTNLQTKFLDIIAQHTNELSNVELEFLQEKIKLMRLNIGNLPTGVLNDYYHIYYADLQFERYKFAENFRSVLFHSQLRRHDILQVHRADNPKLSYFNWRYASPAYVQSLNLLIIPFAYLRQPVFHHQYHELFLYAELGNTLGHELMHGFDTTGLLLDAWGNPSSIFSQAMSKSNFQQQLQCLQHESTSSINEKIADFSGFRLAYESYFERPDVPDFIQENVLSNKQLFYIKFAQFFCAVSPNRIQYDESHDTPFKRVPQVVANQKDFAEVFNCDKNRTVKCNLW